MRIARIAVALTLLMGVHAVAQAPIKGPTLDIPYNSISYNVAPLWLAVDAGAFARYKIDARTEFAAESPAIVASMLSGKTPFAMVGEDHRSDAFHRSEFR